MDDVCTGEWTGLCPLGCHKVESELPPYCLWTATEDFCIPSLGSRRVDYTSVNCQVETDTEYHIVGMTTGPNEETYGFWDNQGGAHTDKSRNPDIRGFQLNIDGAPTIESVTANRDAKTASDFKMTELIIYGRQLKQEEAQQVVSYLQYKYFSDTGSAPLLEPSPKMQSTKFRTHQLQTHDFLCLLSNDASYIKISDIEIYHAGEDAIEYSSAQRPSMREIYDTLHVDEVQALREHHCCNCFCT